MTRKDFVKAIVAVLIFLTGFGCLTLLMEPKWNYYGNQTQTRVQAFYRQEKNTHDVIYTGSSFAYCGISPLWIWKEQGLTGYVFANPMQKTWISYYYLEEALKYQSPKVVVYEVGTVMDDEEGDEGHNRKNIDYLKWSSTKWNAIMEITENCGESKKDYLFPLLRFHSRWSDLGKNDFNVFYDKSYYLMGTALKLTTRPASDKDIAAYGQWDASAKTAADVQVGSRCQEYMLKMKALCEEKGISFLLLREPSMEWSPQASAAVKVFAEENGIDFLDMNDYRDEIGLDWKTDSHDAGTHVNILGCTKVSGYIGKYLKEHYDFDSGYNKDIRTLWDESSLKFESLVASYSLPIIHDYAGYLEAVQNPDFITAIAETHEDGSPSALRIIDGGETIKENADTAPFSMEETISGKMFQLSCGVDGQTASLKVDGKEYAAGQAGVNIIVYDKTLGQVVDSVVFHPEDPVQPDEHIAQPLVKDDGGE